MEKRTREILALILLIVLGVAVACAMAWYILAGHSWNHAATRIDDMVGSMDGYTVVVFDGVVKKPKSETSSSKQSIQAEKSSAASEKSRIPNGKSDTAADGTGDASEKSDDSAEKSNASAEKSAVTPEKSSQSRKKSKLTAAKIAAEYEEKGASALLLNMTDFSRYEEPSILKRSGKRIGIFSSTGPYRMHMTSIRAKIRYLQKHEVDLIVIIADDRSMLTDRIEGADLLLLSKGGGLPGRGGMRGSMFCVDSPYRGEVQTVIVSPSNVMTAQTITGQH